MHFIIWTTLGIKTKTRFDQILAKLINQGVAAALLIEHVPKILKIKNFPLLEYCRTWRRGGGQFWVEENDYGHSLKLNPFSGGK